jgi:hypothetical protein
MHVPVTGEGKRELVVLLDIPHTVHACLQRAQLLSHRLRHLHAPPAALEASRALEAVEAQRALCAPAGCKPTAL